ncbi:AAA family ATPase [Acidianus sulfidivorans JP7]|uniref:ATP-binding protein n=1 Tax=Acidianus sulfidivorans TaxID=312539 RepID=UPI00144315FC|nr:ATP-binding protein [Acidianus sulfidivorans]AWR96826.2 AAA family ATPase [Acidianus sulfidivorans JP7]
MIEEQNPWWISKNVEENETYRKYKESPVKWVPDVIDKISLDPYSLNIIVGPRQVGKTTALILLVEKLLKQVENPKAIFYFSCDKLADYKELDEVLQEYLKVKKAERIKTSYIILDEVTFPKEWFRAIKYRIDRGDFKNDVIVLTGSLSMKAKGEVESFPGRRGSGKILIMYPLPFSKFLELFNVNLPKGNVDFALRNAIKFIEYRQKIKEIFEIYLNVGGFPNAIRDYFERGKISNSTVSDFVSSIILDINKLRRSEHLFKATVKGIIERTASEFSFHTLAKEVGSVRTVISYTELLEKLFLLKTLTAIDPNTGNMLTRKERKFYFIDPFIYEVFSNWTMTKKLDENKLTEAVVVSHLSRMLPTFYLKRNGEVDIVIKNGEKFTGLEVKYGKNVRKYIGKIKDIVYLSKEEIDENVIAVPLFLGLLDAPQSLETLEII